MAASAGAPRVQEGNPTMAEDGLKNGNTPAPPGSPDPRLSRRMVLMLPLMLTAMWLWKSYTEGAAQPPIAYSQLYQWVEQGKVESVVLDGEVVDAILKSPETLAGRQIKDLQANLAPGDSRSEEHT